MSEAPVTPPASTEPVSPAPASAPAPAAGGTGGDPGSAAAPGATPPVTPPSPAPGAPPSGEPAASTPPANTPPADTPPIDTTKAGQDFPADWRQKLAGDDKAYLKTLERFASPADMAKSYRELQQKASTLKPAAPPADASPEAIATWRKESGIPEKPEGYFEKLELPTGVVLGEADRPLAENYATWAHDANMTPAQVSKSLAWYYDMADRAEIARQQEDGSYKSQALVALGQEWGADYQPNMAAAHSAMQFFPEEVRNTVFGGRTADGKIVGNDPRFLKAMAALGRELNPTSTLLPAGTTDPVKGVNDRIAEIDKMMQTDRNAYFKNPAIQEEYRQLLTARDKQAARK